MSLLIDRGERLTSVSDAFGAAARLPSVNLLPPEIIESRTFRRTQRVLGATVLLVLVALAGAYTLAVRDTTAAADSLAVSKATGQTLRAEQAKFADVPRVYQAIDDAQSARQSAMGQDVEWSRYLADVSLAMPANVWLTSLDLSLGTAGPVAGTAPAVGGAPVAAAGVGTMTFAGTAIDQPDVAAWLVTLGREKAATDASFSTSARAKIGTKDVVNFSSTAGLDSAALSHRFDRKAG